MKQPDRGAAGGRRGENDVGASRGAVRAGSGAPPARSGSSDRSSDGGPRSVALVGHRAVGKTQLAELLLATTGVVREAGRVEAGDTLFDDDPGSRARRMSLWPSFAWFTFHGAPVELIDTPGLQAVGWPSKIAASGADTTAVVISCADGLERGAEDALRASRQDERALILVLSKVDRGGDIDAIVAAAAERCGRRLALLQQPIWESGRLVGLVDLLTMRCERLGPEGGIIEVEPPEDSRGALLAARERLIEVAALADDALLEEYLENLDLDPDAAWRGLLRGAVDGSTAPVVLTSSLLGLGASGLLLAVSRLGPDPAGWCAPAEPGPEPKWIAQWIATRFDEEGERYAVLRVWQGALPPAFTAVNGRTGHSAKVRKVYRIRGPRRAVAPDPAAGSLVAVWDPLPGKPGDTFTDGPRRSLAMPQPRPAMSWLWLRMEARGERRQDRDDEALNSALDVLSTIDPALSWTDEAPLDGVRLGGQSASQLEHAVDLLRGRLGLAVRTAQPYVRYRERPKNAVVDVMGLHQRVVDGDTKEFGQCWLDVVPVPAEVGFVFRCDAEEDDLPRRFHAPIGEGARRALLRGPLAGYPVQGVRVRCARGEYDVLESTDAHFELAGERAMTAALERAGMELLEPWSEVHIEAPADAVGPVLSDLAAHRGRVLGLQVDADRTVVEALCPDAQLRTLASRLDGIAAGRCWFSARASHLERLPEELVPGAVASSPFVDADRAGAAAAGARPAKAGAPSGGAAKAPVGQGGSR